MTHRLLALVAPLIGLAVSGVGTVAQDLTDVGEIVRRANLAAYYAGADGRAQVRMTITDAQGRQRLRELTILRRDIQDGGDQQYVVLFSRPADVRNTVFLVQKRVGRDDDRWLYLPSLDLVRRIAAGDKRTSFVGSHFLYEDVSGRSVEEDRHELVETTAAHYVVNNTPLVTGSVEFASWSVWIDKTTFLADKMEYADQGGAIFRRIEALEVKEIAGKPTVTRMQASDLRSGGASVAEFTSVEYDLGIPADVFTERTLRNPPRRWFSGR